MRPSSFFVLSTSAPWTAAQFVTGIKAGVNQQTGQRPSRLNVNDMHREAGPAWDLFIQSLQAVYNAPDDDLLSWYQMAGIHGLPFKPYNGVGQVEGGLEKAGYCPHGQLTFITWHRPYMALIEQTIHAQAQKIAARYTGSSAAAYKSAAETLRFPFWDWATDIQLPPVVTEPTITINTPTGPQTMHNPLYSYQFHQFPFTDPDFNEFPSTVFSQFNETKRAVDAEFPSDGVNHYEMIKETLGGQASNVRKLVLDVFEDKDKTFERMASTGAANGGKTFENPHNIIHQYSGGHPRIPSRVGHIQPPEWSAFDPLFWLHHSNVDRLFTLWQAINYPIAMFNGSVRGQAVFGTADGPVTPDSPLKPFQKDASTFWTSKMSESTRVFGYTYPEINDWELSKEELAKKVTAAVNKLYGSSPSSGSAKLKFLRGRAAIKNNGTVTTGKDFAVQIAVDRADLPVPCSIEVSIGETVAGEFALLGMPKRGMGYANIPLRDALEGASVVVGNRTVEEVVNEVKGKMKVVVWKMGEKIPVSDVKSLKVEIEERDFTPAKSLEEFPKFGEKRTFPVDVKVLVL